MPLPILWSLIPATVNLGATALMKPNKKEFEVNTDYIQRYINELMGRRRDRDVYQSAMKPALRMIGSQYGRAQRGIQSTMAREGMGGGAEEAQQQLSLTQSMADKLLAASEQAENSQLAENRRITDMIERGQLSIGEAKESARQAYRQSMGNWRRSMIGAGASLATAGLGAYAQSLEKKMKTEEAAKIAEIWSKISAEGGTDENIAAKIQEGIKSGIYPASMVDIIPTALNFQRNRESEKTTPTELAISEATDLETLNKINPTTSRELEMKINKQNILRRESATETELAISEATDLDDLEDIIVTTKPEIKAKAQRQKTLTQAKIAGNNLMDIGIGVDNMSPEEKIYRWNEEKIYLKHTDQPLFDLLTGKFDTIEKLHEKLINDLKSNKKLSTDYAKNYYRIKKDLFAREKSEGTLEQKQNEAQINFDANSKYFIQLIKNCKIGNATIINELSMALKDDPTNNNKITTLIDKAVDAINWSGWGSNAKISLPEFDFTFETTGNIENNKRKFKDNIYNIYYHKIYKPALMIGKDIIPTDEKNAVDAYFEELE